MNTTLGWVMMKRDHWKEDALCVGKPLEVFFPSTLAEDRWDVVSVVSGRGSRVVVVAGIEVVATTTGTGRGSGWGITDEVVWGNVVVVCGAAVVVGR